MMGRWCARPCASRGTIGAPRSRKLAIEGAGTFNRPPAISVALRRRTGPRCNRACPSRGAWQGSSLAGAARSPYRPGSAWGRSWGSDAHARDGRSGRSFCIPLRGTGMELATSANAGVQRPGCRALRGAGALQVEHSQGEPGSSRVRCNALLGGCEGGVVGLDPKTS